MPSLKKKLVADNLQRKGFIAESKRDHLYLSYKTLDGKQTAIRTKISHSSSSDISSSLIGKMARQCGLSISDFEKFARCTLSQDDYEKRLKLNPQFAHTRGYE